MYNVTIQKILQWAQTRYMYERMQIMAKNKHWSSDTSTHELYMNSKIITYA